MKQQSKEVPALRFPEFSESWELRQLGDVTKISSGGTPDRTNPNYWNGTIPWITTALVDFKEITAAEEYITDSGLKNSSAKVFPSGTVLMAMYGQGKTRGKVGILRIEATTNQACVALLPDKEKLNELFLFQNLAGRYDAIRKLSNSGGQKNLSAQLIKTIGVAFPSLREQYKITAFLSEVDEKIAQLASKKELLLKYKKGVMQQIFDQKSRFKDDDGNKFPDWESKKLGDVVKRVTLKNGPTSQNVLTISAQYGLISQLDFFDRSVAAKDLSGYYLLKRDDFAYNKSYSSGYPTGAIKRLTRYAEGVVSTLYICFKPTRAVDSDFLEQYFESGRQNREIARIAQEGARNHGLLNIGVDDFFRFKISLPCLREQQKIALFLCAIDRKIKLANQQLQKAKDFKKGLFQQMFV